MSLRVGVDLVQVSRIAESISHFGDRFLERVYTEGELAYGRAVPALAAERLAARFAAKEATIKALDLADRGVGFRQIEVRRDPSGSCRIQLSGEAARVATEAGVEDIALSLSHEGDYATATVVAVTTRSHAS
jgi:holo-[acyl-carrier protein] synthase